MDRFMWTGVVLILVMMQFSGCYALLSPDDGNGTEKVSQNLSGYLTQNAFAISQQDSGNQYTTYSGSYFQVDYPSNWIRVDGLTYMGSNQFQMQSDSDLLTAVVPDFQVFAPLSGTDMVAVAVYDFQNLGVTLPFTRDITDLMIQGSVNSTAADGTYKFLNDIMVNGLPGYEYKVTSRGMSGRADIFSRDGRFYLIYYLGENDQKVPEFYNKIVNSFSIVEPEDDTPPIRLSPEGTISSRSQVTEKPSPVPTLTPLSVGPVLLPFTGTKLTGGFFPPGDAYLTVKNSLNSDAVFIITTAGSKVPLVSYFIKRGDSHTIRDIPTGSYNFYYELGSEWNSTEKQFTDGNPSMFSDTNGLVPKLVTYTTDTAGYEVTLYGVSGGTANTRSLDRNSFPKL
ncbi:hypothetical protein [uncultured Methanospirillum sp.]|uniref:hypothetical protein n=1 Tax=uncultured Methanospirillum sp. TaxID=262503 RepID=UPI0029C80C56|nr:hypothetical protein [uncultured Methanospirillum sp.]